ncbi:hypothetical protein K6119_03625 [Paracrocinitomix mangrovi]|uniref:hypothetical protein n=1 Tax=Paracrocinitomix mangrovi TaxID=2862509 RepID=UPI001C8EA3DC|nr:hypothetical protein [Paracrocinitomix mangrovi]UKN02601.1 hypothetical protein K6119_03625 [Paracrocinitomix mangrovi]
MKNTMLITISVLLNSVVFSQSVFKAYFIPDSVVINNNLIKTDSSSFTINKNGTTRIIVWNYDNNAVSVLFKIKDNDKRTKVKSRTEILKKGRWHRPKSKVKFFHEKRLIKIYNWSSNFALPHYDDVKSKSEDRIRSSFVGDNNDTILIVGNLKVLWHD